MKIGPHGINTTPEGLAFASHAPICKQIDGTDLLQAAPDASVRVFRHYFTEQPFAPGAGIKAATAIVGALKGYRHPNLYVEIYNEVGQVLGDGLERHADLVAEAVPVLHGLGVRVAAFSFGSGQPEPEAWRYLRDRQWCGLDLERDAVAIHEYTPDLTIDGWRMLRCGQVPAWLDGAPFPKLIVTECGYDRSGTNAGGWLANGVSADDYLKMLATYDVGLRRLPYVLGATLFTSGSDDWSNFSTDSLDLSRFYTMDSTIPLGGIGMDEQTQDAAIAQEAQQNTLLTEALRRIRQGKWTGADGVDGLIVALQGGKPLDFTPSFP